MRATRKGNNMTDSITYILTSAQCKRMAAIRFAATPTKDGRPFLESVRIKYNSDGFEIMATNSYMVAWRTFVTGDKAKGKRLVDTIELIKGDADDMISVDAIELFDALTAAAKQSPLVNIEMAKDLITISTHNSHTTIKASGHMFPDTIDKEVEASEPEKDTEYSGLLPAFSAKFLVMLVKSTGYTSTVCPGLRFLTTARHGNGDAHMKPIRMELLEGTSSKWNAILMPIRT